MVYEDRSLTCVECGNAFVFSADDQQYHAEKGYTNEPKRCTSCRQARRADRGGGFGGGMPREMHAITCAQCGAEAEVPFLPRGDHPAYCNDCYRQNRDTQRRASY